MRLKFKRHYHIVMLLVAFLTFLVMAIGSQPIVAYMAY